MNRLWYTDGLSRKRYEERRNQGTCPNVLESDFPALMARTMELMRTIRYFNAENQPDGYLYDLFRFQPLMILTEIRQLDVVALERLFRREHEACTGKTGDLREELKTKLDGWDRRLAYCRDLRLTLDLRLRPALSEVGQADRYTVKKEYYSLLEIVRKLQQNYDVYLKEIENSGKNDPALAVLKVFLQNYGEITTRFNERWANIPSFYFEKILHAGFRKPEPDVTWLVLKKSAGDADVTVKKNTAFIAGENEDNTPFCYRATKDVEVGDMEVEQIFSYFLEKDKGRFPAARLDYVTAILRNEIEVCDVEHPYVLFGGEHSYNEPVGLLIESPMLILREGRRSVTFLFRLTGNSSVFFNHLVTEVAVGGQIQECEAIYKLLNDAFYLEISTEEGWKTIPDYVLTYEDGCFFRLVFWLGEHFPPVVGCESTSHGRDSENPVLRVMMNRQAWLFPYSWGRQVEFDEMTIRVEVTGVSSVSLYNVNGQLDTSVPACPFGVQPDRGAWFVFGNYEMAVKSLVRVDLVCQWQQLPDHPQGFYGYYREYGAGIDNYSFRVRTEWLAGKKWLTGKKNKQCLFTPGTDGQLLRDGELPGHSRISCCVSESMPPVGRDEEQYIYGRTRSGFIRVVLEEPEIGFGHAAYRQVFADVMIQNSRRRRPLPVPAVPVSPVVDAWELEYVAEEKICFAVGQVASTTKLYHVCPLASGDLFSITLDRPVILADGPGDCGNLLLGLRCAEGYERVRFFVDMAPLQKEIDLRRESSPQVGENAGRWSVNNGRQWIGLQTEALLEDTTDFFMHSGIIDFLLPEPIAACHLDSAGLFWICASFSEGVVNRPAIVGVYMNAVEVVSDTVGITGQPDCLAGLSAGTISVSEKNLPGIAGISQVVKGRGGRAGGDAGDIRLHMSARIAHRNRAVSPSDYEQLVLEHFPQVMKVKCLPGLNTKCTDKAGCVTLVIVPRSSGNGWSLATNLLLSEVEQLLQRLAGTFVFVDAVNPVYEEMTVRCRVVTEQGTVPGEVIRRLVKKLNGCIAPWFEDDGIPLFGYRFSLQSLQNVIMEDAGVAMLQGLSVLHITEDGERIYRLDEYNIQETGETMISASQPWCVAVPASGHLIKTGKDDDWEDRAGVGKLEVGKTLVIG